MTTDKLNTWDSLTSSNTERVAGLLGETGLCDKRTLPSLEDRIAVVQMMRTEIKWRGATRWESSGTDLPPWRMVKHATQGWSDFGDLLTGDAFLGCLARALDYAGSGWDSMARSPRWDASAAEIIEHTRANFIKSDEDGKIDPDDEAILNLPPAVIVGVHLRMEGHFMECIRDEADLIVNGSVESIQRDIQKRWRKVIDAIIESRKDSEEAASA
jgi:hypothetical protein